MRVLACTSPEAEHRLRRVLAGDEVRMALTTDEAWQALDEGEYDLIVIGMMFDESRALQLLQALKDDAKTAGIPIAAIHGAKTAQSISPQLFELPARALGARDVIDFGTIPDDPAGNAAICGRMRRCVVKPP